MKRDAHYYAILAFCRACGFRKESAYTVAYASQQVDDAKINLMFLDDPNVEIEYDYVNNRPAFFNMATCHSYFRIRTFNYEAMVNNTIAFHFVPGCKGESFTKKLRCRDEAPIILNIFEEALDDDDLYKLGIVLHTYVDTFAHQGFSGLLSKVNDIKNCEAENIKSLGLWERILEIVKHFSHVNYENYLDQLTPAYGHGQALDYPDLPYLVWSYEYDTSDEFNGSYKAVAIDNKERYQSAFRGVSRYLTRYLQKHPHYQDQGFRLDNCNRLMDALILEAHDKDREKNWQKLCLEQGLFSREDQTWLSYEDDCWLKEAFRNYDRKRFDNREIDPVVLNTHFDASHWYGFYLAVKWYKERFFQMCAQHHIHIPN